MRDAQADPHHDDGAIRIGTPLRDAAVDPRPGDHEAPTNAGTADPHGRDSVSIQATAAPTRSEGGDPWYFPTP